MKASGSTRACPYLLVPDMSDEEMNEEEMNQRFSPEGEIVTAGRNFFTSAGLYLVNEPKIN